MFAPTWNDKFDLPDESGFVFDIQEEMQRKCKTESHLKIKQGIILTV